MHWGGVAKRSKNSLKILFRPEVSRRIVNSSGALSERWAATDVGRGGVKSRAQAAPRPARRAQRAHQPRRDDEGSERSEGWPGKTAKRAERGRTGRRAGPDNKAAEARRPGEPKASKGPPPRRARSQRKDNTRIIVSFGYSCATKWVAEFYGCALRDSPAGYFIRYAFCQIRRPTFLYASSPGR